MIFDGRWKQELKHLSREITIWKNVSALDGLARHRLNRAVLYSATVIRKLIEDESEAEAIAKRESLPLPKLKILHASLEAVRHPYIGEEGWTVRNILCPSNYGKGASACLKAKDVCNWLLHSYVWELSYSSSQKCFSGFLIASDFDKEKFVHYISFEEWQKLISEVIENAML